MSYRALQGSFYLFVCLLALSVSSAQGDPLVTIIMDDSYGREQTWTQVTKLLQNLKKGQHAIVYDVTHDEIAELDIDFQYSEKTWAKAYKPQLKKIAKRVKSIGQKSIPGRLEDHISFLARRTRELRSEASGAQTEIEGVILTDLKDARLEGIVKLAPALNLGGLVYNKTPFYVEDEKFTDAVVHVLFPHHSSEDSRLIAEKTCRFWKLYVEKGGGQLGSCQWESLTDRLFNPEVFKPRTHGDLIDKDISEILIRGRWENGVFVPGNFSSETHDSIPGTINGCGIHRPCLSQRSLSVPLTIELSWKGQGVDMDLSIWSDEGRVHFASRSSFAEFMQPNSNAEVIRLKRIPMNAYLRIVHSNGPAPQTVTMRISDSEFEHTEMLDGIFNASAKHRTQEKVYQIPLHQGDLEKSSFSAGFVSS